MPSLPLAEPVFSCTVLTPAGLRDCRAALSAQFASDRAVDDLLLVVTELATNALLHGRNPVRLDVARDGDRILVAVHDTSDQLPEIVDRKIGGRGMKIVDQLSEQWGVEPDTDGKWVWAQLNVGPSA